MKSFVRYGLYLTVASICFTLIIYILGWDLQPIGQKMNWVYWIIMIAVLWIAIKFHRDQERGGYMKFGQGFGYGMKVALVAAVLTAVGNYLYFAFLNPEVAGYLMEVQEEKMLEQGVPESQIEVSLQWMEKTMSPIGMTIFGIIGTIVLGLIISLVISAILRKEDPNAAADVLDSN